jgi:hypothetical protein
MFTRENTPWYTPDEREMLNALAAELMLAKGWRDIEARDAVHLAWLPGATPDQVRRAVAVHRPPLPGEPQEPEW